MSPMSLSALEEVKSKGDMNRLGRKREKARPQRSHTWPALGGQRGLRLQRDPEPEPRPAVEEEARRGGAGASG